MLGPLPSMGETGIAAAGIGVNQRMEAALCLSNQSILVKEEASAGEVLAILYRNGPECLTLLPTDISRILQVTEGALEGTASQPSNNPGCLSCPERGTGRPQGDKAKSQLPSWGPGQSWQEALPA